MRKEVLDHSHHPNENELFLTNQLLKQNKDALMVRKCKKNKYSWLKLVSKLRGRPDLISLLRENFQALNLPLEVILAKDNIPLSLKSLAIEFGNQNCIKALSTVVDTTKELKNQYKFMYEKHTLAQAVDSLINEAHFLYKSLQKTQSEKKHFIRLVSSWIEFIFAIHKVPEDAREPLAFNIILRIKILNGIPTD